jgi:nicotinate-nucleotide adenylyltransferase
MKLVTRTGRIGLLGGTLDPIHAGHIETALAAERALALDPVLIMPSRTPPHREQGPAASAFHRFAMAALAVSDRDRLTLSDEELCTDGPSYTALTLDRLITRGLLPTQIFFITGADAFAEIETWYRYPGVLDLAHFVVVSRPDVPVATIPDRLPQLARRFHQPARTTPMPSSPAIFLVDAPTPDVSSTEIRRRLREGLAITGLVPPLVEAHILRHHLYSEPRTVDHLR